MYIICFVFQMGCILCTTSKGENSDFEKMCFVYVAADDQKKVSTMNRLALNSGRHKP